MGKMAMIKPWNVLYLKHPTKHWVIYSVYKCIAFCEIWCFKRIHYCHNYIVIFCILLVQISTSVLRELPFYFTIGIKGLSVIICFKIHFVWSHNAFLFANMHFYGVCCFFKKAHSSVIAYHPFYAPYWCNGWTMHCSTLLNYITAGFIGGWLAVHSHPETWMWHHFLQ